MVAALATMESMTSEQITNTGSVSGDCGSAQARARTHVQAYVQTQARQNGSAEWLGQGWFGYEWSSQE